MILSERSVMPTTWRLTMRRALFVVAAAASMVIGTDQAMAQVSSATQALQLGTPNLSVEQGKSVTMNMRWQAVRLPTNYTVFVHLVAANGTQYPGGDHAPSVSTSTWSGLVSYNHTRAIPSNLPVGNYTVRVGLYSGDNRVTLVPGAGVTHDGQQRYIVGNLNVRAPGTAAPAPAPAPTPAPTQSSVNMLSTPNLTVAPGGSVTMGMRFNGVRMSTNATVFVHFVAANGTQYPGGDHAPSVPTTTWNGPVSYNHTRVVPANMPQGTYSIRVGLYSGSTRYPLTPGSGVTADAETRYTVGTLTVGSAAPAPAPANCSFNGQTVAHGQSVTAYQASSVPAGQTCVSQSRTCNNGTLSGTYTNASCTVQAAPARSMINMLGTPNVSGAVGSTVNMAMRWNAVPMNQNYQVFVHFVAADGTQYAGGDHAPSVPTSTWSGSVSYNHARVLPSMPAGTYSIRVGLYQGAAPYARAQLDPGQGVTADAEMRYTVGTLTVTASAPAPGPTPSPAPAPGTQPGPYGQDANAYVPTFSDEFNNGFNTAVWNDTIWYEASNPTKNYAVEDGKLKIWPQRDANGQFFNRTIDTDGKYYQTYGFFEIEAKLPYGKGTWPAFWLFNHIGDRRPEIDVMEAYAGGGPNSGWSDANLHPTAFAATVWITGNQLHDHKVLQTSDLSAAFHKYAVKWEPNRLTFYFDGREFWTTAVSFPDRMYLMLDLWYGSASGTPDNSTPQGKSNSYEVNYIRAWRFK